MDGHRGAREAHLEGMRGVAALMVVVFHSLRGFVPAATLPGQAGDWIGLIGTPLWAFVNGPFAVVFFFLLSGYVLTRRPLETGDRSAIVEGGLKRWPRLAGPATVAVLLGWLFVVLGLDMKSEASGVTGSLWILQGGVTSTVQPSLTKAFLEGAVLTFFRGDHLYNGSLWTMRLELAGSLVSYALAFFLLGLPRRGVLPAFVLCVAAGLCHQADGHYVAFVAGVAYARYRPTSFEGRIANVPALAMWALAILAAGYVPKSGGVYALLEGGLPPLNPVYVHLFASMLMLAAADGNPALRRAFSGRVGRFLGRVSFPLYLIHTVVLCSAGAATVVLLRDFGGAGALAAILVTVWLSLVCAVPLAVFNEAWLSCVNAATRALTNGKRAADPGGMALTSGH